MTASANKRRIAIIGGSLGGLFAGAVLARRGHDVKIFERSATELAGRGAGILVHDITFTALAAAGITDVADLGVPLVIRRTYARDGRLVGELPFPQLSTAWDRLFQILRERIPAGRYTLGKSLVRVDETERDVIATFADGTTAAADLLIAADGFRSVVRGQVLPGVQPQYAGYVAWRGMIEEAVFPARNRATIMRYFSFCFPPGEQFLGYPVAGAGNTVTEGQRRFNFVWYRPAHATRDLPRLLTDAHGRCYDLAIPPPMIARDVVAEMRADAERLLAPMFAEAVRLTSSPFFQPIYDLAVSRMLVGRVVLIGDAAFVARPHVGAGVTKAAFDAIALADALDTDAASEHALRDWETARLAEGRRLVDRARALGAGIRGATHGAIGSPAGAVFDTPEAVMRETGTLVF